jgi:hypothetical protein
MISFFIGRPGEGKSYAACRKVLEHFKNRDTRVVVTNIFFNVGNVAEFLAEEGWEFSAALEWVNSHYRCISEDEAKKFYLCRGNFDIPLQVLKGKGKETSVGDYSTVKEGVFYVLDELHILFPSREWQSSGAAAIYYLSQHRKLSDDVVCITQHPKLIDTQFRLLSQEWIECVNNYRRRVGFITPPKWFVQKFFPTIPDKSVPCIEKKRYTMNPKIARCYDSMAGVGVSGALPATLPRSRGIPLFFAIAFIFFGLLALAFILSKGGEWLAGKAVGHSGKGVPPVESFSSLPPVFSQSQSLVANSSNERLGTGSANVWEVSNGRRRAPRGSRYSRFGSQVWVNGEEVEADVLPPLEVETENHFPNGYFPVTSPGQVGGVTQAVANQAGQGGGEPSRSSSTPERDLPGANPSGQFQPGQPLPPQ